MATQTRVGRCSQLAGAQPVLTEFHLAVLIAAMQSGGLYQPNGATERISVSFVELRQHGFLVGHRITDQGREALHLAGRL